MVDRAEDVHLRSITDERCNFLAGGRERGDSRGWRVIPEMNYKPAGRRA